MASSSKFQNLRRLMRPVSAIIAAGFFCWLVFDVIATWNWECITARVTDCRVVNVRRHRSDNNTWTPRYDCKFAYTFRGEHYTGKDRFTFSQSEGSDLTIAVNPDSPQNYRTDPHGVWRIYTVVTMLGLGAYVMVDVAQVIWERYLSKMVRYLSKIMPRKKSRDSAQDRRESEERKARIARRRSRRRRH